MPFNIGGGRAAGFDSLIRAILTLLRCRYNKTAFGKTIWIIGIMVRFPSLSQNSHN